MRLGSGVLVAVLACALVAAVGCSSEERANASQAADAKDEAAETLQKGEGVADETKPPKGDEVTATLTYFESEEKGTIGAKKTREVPYLSEGSKVATLETTKGVIRIELWEEKAPNTVVNFVSLANSGRYDGVTFHRVIEGFMAQTGDVEHKDGRGGPGYTIPAEFDASLKHERGVVSMARAQDPNSAGSQFFIMFQSANHLDGKYAAFGKVIEGMDVVDSLQKGDGPNGAVSNPDKIEKLRVEVILADM